ncbi:hypothetical protein KIM372_16370 [Bombiscardovia nodaiensis]|uniref:Gram-positive cocci surface proteins LPxTG domain-containing protein n=1 Tax=Bombiscardovia nodaiensis TaxID=2932181 RepID=A0ABN6SC83_9BIFI|nr:hypothetical protein KIM372_16370 [Bombiscardovia nodaiensis]
MIINNYGQGVSGSTVFSHDMRDNISSLDLNGTHVPDWTGINNLVNIADIDADGSGMTTAELQALSTSTVAGNIIALNISNNPGITDYAPLGSFGLATESSHLGVLVMMNNNATDAQMAAMATLPGVGTLNAQGNPGLTVASYNKFPNARIEVVADTIDKGVTKVQPGGNFKLALETVNGVALTPAEITASSPAGGSVAADGVTWSALSAAPDAVYSYQYSHLDPATNITYTGTVKGTVHVHSLVEVTFNDLTNFQTQTAMVDDNTPGAVKDNAPDWKVDGKLPYWSIDKEGKVPFDLDHDAVTADTVLYAQWQKSDAEVGTVEFVDSMDTKNVLTDQITLGAVGHLYAPSLVAIAKWNHPGYRFDRWTVDLEGKYAFNVKEGKAIEPMTTLFAQWVKDDGQTAGTLELIDTKDPKNAITAGITLGKKGDIYEQTQKAAATWSHEGFQLDRWTVDPEGKYEFQVKEGVAIEAMTTLYAQWKEVPASEEKPAENPVTPVAPSQDDSKKPAAPAAPAAPAEGDKGKAPVAPADKDKPASADKPAAAADKPAAADKSADKAKAVDPAKGAKAEAKAQDPESLAYTGSNILPFAGAAVVLLALAAVGLVAARRFSNR